MEGRGGQGGQTNALMKQFRIATSCRKCLVDVAEEVAASHQDGPVGVELQVLDTDDGVAETRVLAPALGKHLQGFTAMVGSLIYMAPIVTLCDLERHGCHGEPSGCRGVDVLILHETKDICGNN